jgi:hypothetical protein
MVKVKARPSTKGTLKRDIKIGCKKERYLNKNNAIKVEKAIIIKLSIYKYLRLILVFL